MFVLQAFRPAHAQALGDTAPYGAIMKRPPLPRGVLASKAFDDPAAAWMSAAVLSCIDHDAVDHNPWT